MKASSNEIKGLKQLQAELQQAHQIIWGLHWSMFGKGFLANHPFLDDPLEEIDEMVDWVAERIVQLGDIPIDSYEEVLKLATSKSIESRPYAMSNAISGIKVVLAELDKALYDAREKLDSRDTATSSQIDSYIGTIEKYLWMISSESSLESSDMHD
ncbi:DNA binding protein [Lactobacillus phage Lbab1]|nr:DNA binding protein [Lactobacillus phage Lbab1]